MKIVEGDLGLNDLMTDFFIRDLHKQLYGGIWTWAKVPPARAEYRRRAGEHRLRTSLQNMLYRFEHTEDWDPRQFGIAVHDETVRIHPFTDGNGRTTRLLANLIFLAAQDGEQLQEYDWTWTKALTSPSCEPTTRAETPDTSRTSSGSSRSAYNLPTRTNGVRH